MEIKSSGWLAGQLERPKKPVDVVLDTDTYNEIDDQFALAYLIGSSDRLNLQGIYGAPFFNQKSLSPRDGMEKSYEEIMNILSLMKREDLKPLVCKGSDRYLPSENEAVDSPAARDLTQRSTVRKIRYMLSVLQSLPPLPRLSCSSRRLKTGLL